MSQRHLFVLRSQEDGSNHSALCREFNISRKTGYKWLDRFAKRGVRGLMDMDKGAQRGTSPLNCSAEMALDVLAIRDAHPTWGARKLRAVLERENPGAEDVPSVSTIGRILRREGRIQTRRRRRLKTSPGKRPEVEVKAPNDLWTVDFKGWWKSLGGKRCEPLTVRDAFSKKVLAVRLVRSTSIAEVRAVFEDLFARYGLPKALLTDNGSPFAANTGKVGLTRLSAWWVALGIRWVRSRPGCPQDNGGHERMHRDMKAELQLWPSKTQAAQQAACERWRLEFNAKRPHEALDMATPDSVYRKSDWLFTGNEPVLVYPERFLVRSVSSIGTVRYAGNQKTLGRGLAGRQVGFEPLPDKRFRVWFAGYCIGVGELPWSGVLRPPGPGVAVL